ncbi:uncharacterized protein LOC133914665 [Phragmites australis]|uniref:uncharacterized protein LOC133914665 n=1 Tax=Phragmites australis TaxID=29695 RepID=UPI002D79A9A9|nr:uncharacterized protein LOC133914665 [Phragmites australis]
MIPDIFDGSGIITFKRDVKDKDLVGKLATWKINTIEELFKLADKCANGAEALTHAKNPQSDKDKPESSKNEGKKKKPGDKQKGLDTIIVAVDRSKSRNARDNKGLRHDGRKWCPFHRTKQHDFDEYHTINNKLKDKLKTAIVEYHSKQVKPYAKDDEPGFHEASQNLAHIFRGSIAYESKRQYKVIEREVNLALTGPPRYLKWSDVLITFGQVDHPAVVSHPGWYLVVVQPTILNVKVFRTLVDEGSSLNLIFTKTLDKMGNQSLELKTEAEPFHDITPNLSTMPLVQIELLVMFGEPDNFCTEKLNFDVVDFKITYNVILGRPMPGRFMAVVHYVYQVLKIPDPKGVITIKGGQCAVVKCDR